MTLSLLRREGRQIVDAVGQPVLLRGVGLGNWLLPEGYMWHFGDDAASPWQIEALITDLIGQKSAQEFWRRFRDTYITDQDIAAIAAYGYNSVRLPINWRIVMTEGGEWIEDGFDLIARTVEACRRHDLYVVLDLHGAPGGQTGTNIDDSAGWPDLFTDPRNRQLTIRLWQELARRYRHDPVIAGYDLLNEPLPGDHRDRYRDQLVRLYQDLISAVRAVDPDHLIILEGMHWSNDWSIFTELWDDQVVLQFHKYWNAPDTDSIRPYLDTRERLDVPIWLGESGENHLAWFQGTFGMCDDLGIGWNFWQWKKLGTRVSPVSIRVPDDWHLIQAAAAGGDRPDAETVAKILDQYLDNIALDACEQHQDVVHAMMRRAPLRLYAAHFPVGGDGISWSATRLDTGLRSFRESEGVTLAFADPEHTGEVSFPATGDPYPRPADALEVRLAAGEWVTYRFDVRAETDLTATLLGATSPDTRLRLSLDGTDLPADPSALGHAATALGRVGVGPHTLTVTVDNGWARLSAIDVGTRQT
ncbi:cellulase family glycosylhydrolase [Streptomyces himalayensis]|uniref:Cellulase family glycosylhydrolase n=1 Tax=Streptomyces himalayensis subsp. himalayensis TaxID=2756131 RepID=A0A7W0DKW5_9ACTN|nr:cellulase family glycosylhydrolase [Streptomyces himalayensis]MBA2946994.1 cellulase family glycosylhydrolase [Streptomyces himalayensis subsp. himalayensis]